MRRGAVVGAAWLAAAAFAGGCGEPRPAAPVEPRAAWLLEMPQIRVGDVAALERLVVTPPGWTVAPFVPGPAPEGFWLLDAEALPVERQATRWLHRTQLRIRAREVGRFTWPPTTASIEAPDGEKRELALDPLPLEVISVLPEAADQLTPMGVRPLPETPARSLLAAAAAGACASLAALALGLLVVRRRRARALAPRDEAPDALAETRARASFALARAMLPDAPVQAADAIAGALRRFVWERYRVSVLACTSEELAAQAAPFALATRWTRFAALLAALDAVRFAAPEAAVAHAAGLADLLPAAEAFVGESLPPAPAR